MCDIAVANGESNPVLRLQIMTLMGHKAVFPFMGIISVVQAPLNASQNISVINATVGGD